MNSGAFWEAVGILMSTMQQIERSLVFDTVGCRSIQPGFSKQGPSGGIRPPFECQLQPWQRQA